MRPQREAGSSFDLQSFGSMYPLLFDDVCEHNIALSLVKRQSASRSRFTPFIDPERNKCRHIPVLEDSSKLAPVPRSLTIDCFVKLEAQKSFENVRGDGCQAASRVAMTHPC
jgi:hypothetical protein